MPAPAETKYVRVEDGNVANSVALLDTTDNSGPGAYSSAGCLTTDLDIQDTKDENQVTASNWCTQANRILKQYREGDRDIQFSGTLEMLLDDPGTEIMAAAYETTGSAEKDLFWKSVFSDNQASPVTKTYEYRGFLKEWSKVGQMDNTAKYRFSYRVKEILQDGA